MTLAEEIEQVAKEPIISIVIGKLGWGEYGVDHRHEPGLERRGEILTWEEARPLLDYDYDSGFGSPDCHAIWAWTESYVVCMSIYDGSTWPSRVPRHPSLRLEPYMLGGG